MVEQLPVKEMVAGSSPAEAANYAPLSQSGRGDGFRIHEVQVRVLCGAPIYPISSTNRMLAYEAKDGSLILPWDTMIFSSNWQDTGLLIREM